MNANQIINMIMRVIMRKVINKGVNAGINTVARGRKGRGPDMPPPQPRAPVQSQTEQPGEGGMTRDEVRAQRRARRAAREAREQQDKSGG